VLGASLSTGHKSGILIVAAIFVVFALCSAFVFPRMNPNFPGKRLWLFVAGSAVLTLVMLGTLFTLAKEPPEAGAKVKERPPALPQTTSTETAPPAAPKGDAVAGKALFAAQGCTSCHTFKPAGATGKVGPDLDNLKAEAAKANRGSLTAFIQESIVNPPAYIAPGYPGNVMPNTFRAQIPPGQLHALVQYLAAGAK
jgi:mono/diheme cytochrome c family protein